MSSSQSPSLDAGFGPVHLPEATVSLGGLHPTPGLPYSSLLALLPHPALVALGLDSLETTASTTPLLFLAASELDPSKIINGSAKTLGGGFGVSAARPFPGSRL